MTRPKWPGRSKSGDNGCVVGRPLVPAHFDVYAARPAIAGKSAGQQDMVNAQPHLAPKCVHAIIPPGVRFLRLVEQPEAVLEADSDQALKGLPLSGAA